ncbi:MAG TPA: hypothetical protein VH482_29340 [Thermomicrobiales bacterium]
MSMRPLDPLVGAPRGDPERAIAFANDSGCSRPANVKRFVEEVYRLAPRVGLDPAIAVAKAANETGDPEGRGVFVSFWWVNRLNPAGLGITGDPDENERSPTFADGTEAARAMVAHLYAYAVGDPDESPVAELRGVDPRREAFLAAGLRFGFAETIQDLAGTWAVAADDAEGTCARGNAIWSDLPDVDPGDDDMDTRHPKFLIVAGHRNTGDSGGPHEAERTPALARAHRDAIRDAGFEVHYLQEEDGDDDPDFTNGGLDDVGRLCRDFMADRDGFWVMIDCHYADDGGPNGVFAIYPMSDGLATLVGGDQSPDAQGNNPLDEQFGVLAATHIAQTTGLPLRSTGGMKRDGLMAEDHTGVGLEGSRLAMFAYTVSLQPRAVRLVIEHGDGVFDADIIEQDDFTEKASAGLAAAVREMWGGDDNGHPNCELVRFTSNRTFHTQTGALGRNEPKTASDVVRHFTAGQTVVCDGLSHCDSAFGDDRWVHIAGANGAWIHSSGIDEDPGT